MDSEVRAVAAVQIQRHQLSIKIFKGRLLHVILFIFLLPYTGEWIHFTQNDMHIKKLKRPETGQKRQKERNGTNKTRDKTSIWSVVIV